MDLSGKTIHAHGGCFDSTCPNIYRMNSPEVCAISGARPEVGVIELDVRKSKDGFLYCYHGTFFEYYFSLKFPRSLAALRKKYGVSLLEELLDVIPADKSVFLDIKDTSVTREDVSKVFAGRKFKEVILGNRSVSFLRRFSEMPPGFVKVINGNILCGFYNLRKLKTDGFKYFEVIFPFQVNKKMMEKTTKAGLELRYFGLLFSSKESYWRKIDKYGLKHVSSDFI